MSTLENQSKYYAPCDPVSVIPMDDYTFEGAYKALEELLAPIGNLDFVKSGMTVVIKANLVSAMKPEEAATTHPVLLSALTKMITEKGASVIIGDSPGGLYNSAFVGRVYKVAGMHETEKYGATLNDDYSQKATEFPDAKVLRSFTYTGYLDKADVIINFCKLKSHGMMGMSCAAKNMFGTIPGVIKPEYHYRFPKYEDFADMIVDLDEYFHPVLSIADAVVGMEGNGPTAGTPKKMGCLIASHSPHNLDYVASKILGFDRTELPILDAAYRRGAIYENFEDVKVFGDIEPLILKEFERVVERKSLKFSGDGSNKLKVLGGKIAEKLLMTKPKVKKDMCVGCGICAGICPAKAITIKKKLTTDVKDGKAVKHYKKWAVIDRKKCIRCFCCQEFCPKSAIKVQRTAIANLFHSENIGKK